MNIEEIIKFLYSQDIYYYDSRYNKDDLRDPKIFRYIPITDSGENYKINIDILKKYKIWKLYEESTKLMRKQFYESFLSQIKKIRDLKNIFNLFSLENINKELNILINKKMDEIVYTVLDEKEENFTEIFEIFKNVLICNKKNELEKKLYILNYNFTSKYFFYLLKNKRIQMIVDKIKQNIIDFFLE